MGFCSTFLQRPMSLLQPDEIQSSRPSHMLKLNLIHSSLNVYRNVFKQAKLNSQLHSNHISLLTATVWLHTSLSTASLLVYYVGFPLVLEFIVSTEISQTVSSLCSYGHRPEADFLLYLS